MHLMRRDTDYAIRALCLLARHEAHVFSVREITGKLKISRPFLRKVLQTLTRSRMITSYKGRGGGFMLGMPAGQITVIDVFRVFQGRYSINKCFLNKAVCPNARLCKLKKKINGIERKIIRELKSISIASLL